MVRVPWLTPLSKLGNDQGRWEAQGRARHLVAPKPASVAISCRSTAHDGSEDSLLGGEVDEMGTKTMLCKNLSVRYCSQVLMPGRCDASTGRKKTCQYQGLSDCSAKEASSQHGATKASLWVPHPQPQHKHKPQPKPSRSPIQPILETRGSRLAAYMAVVVVVAAAADAGWKGRQRGHSLCVWEGSKRH